MLDLAWWTVPPWPASDRLDAAGRGGRLLPLAWVVLASQAGVVALWWALVGWLVARQVAVALRYRSTAWLRTGPS